jgi:hypothetical protein
LGRSGRATLERGLADRAGQQWFFARFRISEWISFIDQTGRWRMAAPAPNYPQNPKTDKKIRQVPIFDAPVDKAFL